MYAIMPQLYSDKIGPRFAKIGLFMEKMNEGVNIAKHLADHKPTPTISTTTVPPTTTTPITSSKVKVLCMLMLGVHAQYRSGGIARKLVAMSLQLGGELGCTCAKVEALNVRTHKLYESLGFVTVNAVRPVDVLVDGLAVFTYKDSTTEGKLMIKIID